MTDDTARPAARHPRQFSPQNRHAALAERRRRQAEHDQAAWPRIAELRDQGHSWRQICRTLEAEGIPTPSGRSRWQPVQVQRIARRQQEPPPRPSLLHRLAHWLSRV